MFPYRQRLVSGKDIKGILAKGKKLRSKYLKLVYLARESKEANQARFAVIVGLKQSKKAVERNRLKRRYRALAAKYEEKWPNNTDVVLFPNKDALIAKYTDIEADYLDLLPS